MRARLWLLVPAALMLPLGGCGFFPRMTNQPSIKPYEQDMPAMPARTVPTTGGDRLPPPGVAAVQNPIQPSAAAVRAGRVFYGYYCRHCHGQDGRSRTPVGDSYVPKPTDLTSARVQQLSDSELVRAMLLGRGHEPVMQSTVRPARRWYIVHFIRTLAPRR